MPVSLYFDTPFGTAGTLATIPDAVQVDGSVSYNQGWGIDYTLPSSNPSYKYMPWGQFNQLFYDITVAIQNLQQGSPPAFITSAMNLGTPYTYPQGARVSHGGTNYYSLVGSNADTPPTAKWAVDFSGQAGSFTAGHIAVFADAHGTIEDGGPPTSGYTLPAATTSTLGGVIPDGTIISVDGTGHITVVQATNTLFGVVKVDNSTIGASAGVISIKSSAPLAGSPTTTTQSAADNSTKIATTAYVDRAVSTGAASTPLGLYSYANCQYSSAIAAGGTVSAGSLSPGFIGVGGGFNASSSSLSGTYQALLGQSATAFFGNWQRTI